MEAKVKKQAAMLGGRIGFMFLVASSLLIIIAYFLLSKNFQNMITNYTITLVQSLVDQGVTTIEYELNTSLEEAKALAQSLAIEMNQNQSLTFPKTHSKNEVIRMIYISQDGAIASDGSLTDRSSRQDIVKAYAGETAMYGPYFNEQNEYIICYSAPVYENDEIIGVWSIEKDGYYFCDLIQDIRFVNSGESYIINQEGTDIAVSNLDHISWVNDQYNARSLLETQKDTETLSIMELEEKGLAGQRGVGTYSWQNGLCYVVYSPISSVHWVLLAGIRQEEIDAMAYSVLYTSLTNGPVLGIVIAIFLSLTILIIYWILSSMKKSAEMNQMLNTIANYDALTGIMNRNGYNNALNDLQYEKLQSLSCIYIDVNGLHEINNHLGHQAGDNMLKAVARVLCYYFGQDNVYRIGGDEFVVFCKNENSCDIYDRIKFVREDLRAQNYEISVGIKSQNEQYDVKNLVNAAEEAMRQDKHRFYRQDGRERQLRTLDQELEQMVLEKQDADAFLSILAPEFKGVYFVDLASDAIRHLYIPAYFEAMLKESNDKFSKALHLYIDRVVISNYRQPFEKFCDYNFVEKQLDMGTTLEFTYQKTDETWMKLRILKFKAYTKQHQETLWIFSNIEV